MHLARRKAPQAARCSRSLITTSCEVALKVPKLKGISFKTVAIVSCRCRESSVKKP